MMNYSVSIMELKTFYSLKKNFSIDDVFLKIAGTVLKLS